MKNWLLPTFAWLLLTYLGVVINFSYSWEQSYFNMTAPNFFGSSSINFGFCHPKVGSCHGMLGEVIYFAMTESPLRIHFYVLLPKYLGAVMLLSYCSQNSWEQSYLYLTAPKFFGSSQIMIGNSVYEVHMLLPNIFYCSQFLWHIPTFMFSSEVTLAFFFFEGTKKDLFHDCSQIFLTAPNFFDCSQLFWEQSLFLQWQKVH
jgi:hypothetical protein